MSTALLSSFELLIQPIIPLTIAPPGVPDPVAVQAYFLLISNINDSDVNVSLEFITNPVGQQNILQNAQVFLDVTQFKPLSNPKIISPTTASVTFLLGAQQTVLFLLQPDISILNQGPKANFEARGAVNISAPPGSQLLLSPQVRGTFFQFDSQGKVILPSALTESMSNVVPTTVLDAMSSNQSSMEVQPLPPEKISTPLLSGMMKVYAQQAYSLPTVIGPLYTFTQ